MANLDSDADDVETIEEERKTQGREEIVCLEGTPYLHSRVPAHLANVTSSSSAAQGQHRLAPAGGGLEQSALQVDCAN